MQPAAAFQEWSSIKKWCNLVQLMCFNGNTNNYKGNLGNQIDIKKWCNLVQFMCFNGNTNNYKGT